MRTARIHAINGTLQLDTDVPDPVAGPGEVVVDLAFASVNPLDIWVSRGAPGAAAANLPWIPGTEASGHVDGKPVLVRGGGIGVVRRGLYAEKAAVPASCVMPIPDGVDLAQAAALGVAGITAWHAVHTKAGVTATDRVLVLGASGGVGAMAVQLAAAAGATVCGQTSNSAKTAGILRNGAGSAIVCHADDMAEALDGFVPTVVLDALGGPYTDAAIAAMDNEGRLVTYGTSADEIVTLNMRTLYRKGITLKGYTGLRETAAEQSVILGQMFASLADGSLRVPIDEILPLGGAADAFARILAKKVEGKLVLNCRQ
jgi:NADPH:quinone reductase